MPLVLSLQQGYVPVSSSWILIEQFPKPEMTIVPAGVLDVANEYTSLSKFFLDISGPPTASRQGNNGKRWQVFMHISRTDFNSFFTFGYSSAHDCNLSRRQRNNSFSICNKILHIILHECHIDSKVRGIKYEVLVKVRLEKVRYAKLK